MSAEDMPSIDETNRQLDRALWREMRKPLAAGAVAALSFFVGNQFDNSHQAHADELGAEFHAGYDSLSGNDRVVVDAYLSGHDLPKSTSQQVADEAHKLGDLSEEQRHEEETGGTWTFAGQIASLYAGVKVVGVGFGRMLGRDTIKRRHPDLAPARVKSRADRLVIEGRWVEYDAELDEKYGFEASSHSLFFQDQLREVGSDIEAAESFSYNREGLDRVLTGMLNNAQFEVMIDGIDGNKEVAQLGLTEALQIRVINDLWKPADTFLSVKDWYNYRRRQVITPGAFHRIDENGLYLPKLEQIDGGIGIAVGRIAQYWCKYTELRQNDRVESSDAMVSATEGAATLDELAPREDGSHWIDYIDSLVKGVDLTSLH